MENDASIRGVAGVLLKGNRILLVKRKYGSKKGTWCIPCGKVEPGEKLDVAVVREVLEETHLNVSVEKVVHQVNTTHRSGVPYQGTWFKVEHISGTLQADDDAEEAGFFALDDLPELAFEDDLFVMRHCL